jgi:SAM-dependent methyltransferase
MHLYPIEIKPLFHDSSGVTIDAAQRLEAIEWLEALE